MLAGNNNIDTFKFIMVLFLLLFHIIETLAQHIDIDMGIIDMVIDQDNSLTEITVTAKMPEKMIWIERRNEKIGRLSQLVPLRKKQYNQYDIWQDFKKYIGKWQWNSANGDTVLTIDLIEANVSWHTKFYRDAEHFFQEDNLSAYYKINQLFGKYEYRIKDSIIFSNIHDKINFRNKTEEKKQCLIGLEVQESPDEMVQFILSNNPSGKQRGLITYTILDEKADLGLWSLQALKKQNPNHLIVREVTSGDFSFPTKALMKRIGK